MNKNIIEHFIEEGENNKIVEVIVFPENAHLTRQIIANTQLGINVLYIKVNAFNIDNNSIQAIIYGQGEMLSVQYKEIPIRIENISDNDIKNLEIEKRQLIQKRKILEYKQENCSKQKKLLDSLINLPSLQGQLEFRTQYPNSENLKESLENLKVMLDLLNQNYIEITEQEEQIFVELQAVKEQELLIEQNLSKVILHSNTTQHKIIEVVFDAKNAKKIKMELSYIALQATWKPSYKLDINADSKKVNMTLFAHIEQKTGEDWQGVRLSVSNSATIKTTILPDLTSWQIQSLSTTQDKPSIVPVKEVDTEFESYLDDTLSLEHAISEVDICMTYGKYKEAEELLSAEIAKHPENSELKYRLLEVFYEQEVEGSELRNSLLNFFELSDNSNNKSSLLKEFVEHQLKDVALKNKLLEIFALDKNGVNHSIDNKLELAHSKQIRSSLAFEYQIPVPIDIISGCTETLLPIQTKKLRGDFFHYSVPKKDSAVYWVCEANFDNDLLCGQLNIYFAGRFVGSSFLEEKQGGKAMLINLGADRDIRIQREKVIDQLAESFLKGMIDRLTVERKLEFCIVSENLKDEAIRLKIIDAVPITNTDRVQINNVLIKPEPQIKNWHKCQGVMQWDMELPARSTKQISISCAIKYPKDYKFEL